MDVGLLKIDVTGLTSFAVYKHFRFRGNDGLGAARYLPDIDLR